MERIKSDKIHGRSYKLLNGRIDGYKETGQPISADWTTSTPKIRRFETIQTDEDTRFEILVVVVTMNINVFWYVTPCSLVFTNALEDPG